MVKTIMSEHSTDQLATLITQRWQCLRQMRELGRKQSELIATGEMESLLQLLAAKQKILSAIQAIERNLDPYHREDPEQRIWSSPQARTQCAQQSADCRLLLEEVMRLEIQNEQLLTHRRDEVASQLQTVHTASLARGAYQAQQSSPSHTTPPDLSSNFIQGTAEAIATNEGLDIQR
jgi:hypothetical protein